MKQLSKHVVVLGAGYAGLMAAMRLAKKTDPNEVAITLINVADTFESISNAFLMLLENLTPAERAVFRPALKSTAACSSNSCHRL